MSTPNKRRRTSPTAYVSVDGQENTTNEQTKTTPKRASYQSPTKASLARSNPTVLQQVAQAKESRESEPNRRRSLRDAVLGNKNILPAQEQVNAADAVTGGYPRHDEERLDTTAGAEEEPAAVTAAPLEQTVTETSRSPHSPSPPPNIPTPRRNGTVHIDSPKIVPKLVQNSSVSETQQRRSSSAELPPTPVQLGNRLQPVRPRGLFSSSPAGARRRRSIRDNHVLSSPLKPKAPPIIPDTAGEDTDHAEVASGIDEDQDEGHGPQDLFAGNATFFEEVTDDPTIQNKQSKLQQLMRDLEKSSIELRDLSNLVESMNNATNSTFLPQTFDDSISTLIDTLPEVPVWPPQLDDHELFTQNAATYLHLFTPASLYVTYRSDHGVIEGHHHLIHQTILTAPAPWPSDTLNLIFDVTTTLDRSAITQILLTNPPTQHSELTNWISFCLAHPILNRCLAILTTGTAAYFEASVKRASIFKHLVEILSSPPHPSQTPIPADSSLSALTKPQTTALLPYLSTTHHKFTSPSSPSKHLMLTSHITLNWIGQATIHTRITVSGFTHTIAENASTLFAKVEAIDGVIAACEAVWQVLKMAGPDADVCTNLADKAKGKKKGVRRMTEFR